MTEQTTLFRRALAGLFAVGLFAAAAPVPGGADLQTRLLALVGRAA